MLNETMIKETFKNLENYMVLQGKRPETVSSYLKDLKIVWTISSPEDKRRLHEAASKINHIKR